MRQASTPCLTATSRHPHGSPPPATSPPLTPSASPRSSSGPRFTSASSVRAPSQTAFRTPPCIGVGATADANARASDSLLRTTAVTHLQRSPLHVVRSRSDSDVACDSADGRFANASRVWSLTLPPHFVCRHRDLAHASGFNAVPGCNVKTPARLAASGDIAPAHAVRLVDTRRRRGRSPPRRQCGLRPSPASALRRPPVSAPLPEPPAACFARLPSPPPALTATQSPWRLPSAGFSGAVSPSLVPLVLSFLTACAGFGSHTPRIADAGGAIGTYGARFSAHPAPSDAAVLLDRAYVAAIHAVHPLPGLARLRLSYTDTRTIHACRCR